jgi:ribose transport system permease protein
MKYTKIGRAMYATGGNRKAAELSGINVNFCRFSIFVILGLAAGISGAMFVCLMRAGSVLYGTDLALTCVAATVVGGTPLNGGKGSVLRTVIGILLIYVLYKGLAFLGLQGYYNTMIRGAVLLSVVALDSFMTKDERW